MSKARLVFRYEISDLFMHDLPLTWTGSEQWHVAHQCACFLEGQSAKLHLGLLKHSMNLIKFKTLRELHPLPPTESKGGASPLATPPFHISGVLLAEI